MTDAARIRVELDMSELVAAHLFETRRDQIDEAGARGIWDGFGLLAVRVNGEAVVALQIHEADPLGVVLDVYPVRNNKTSSAPAYRVELEAQGIVPSRSPRKGK